MSVISSFYHKCEIFNTKGHYRKHCLKKIQLYKTFISGITVGKLSTLVIHYPCSLPFLNIVFAWLLVNYQSPVIKCRITLIPPKNQIVLVISIKQKRLYTRGTIRGLRISWLAEIPPLFSWLGIFYAICLSIIKSLLINIVDQLRFNTIFFIHGILNLKKFRKYTK